MTTKQDEDKPTKARRDDLPRDESGGLIDPPTLPEYEQRLRAAHDQGDQQEIDSITAEYHDAREDRAKVLAQRERERQESDK